MPIEAGCRGLVEHLLHKVWSGQKQSHLEYHQSSWESLKMALDPERKSIGGGKATWTKAGLPGLGCLMFKDPKQLMIPGYFTADATLDASLKIGI